MANETNNYIKKATVSNAEFIGQLVEAALGLVLCVVGAVLGFASETGFSGIPLVVLLIGAYLLFGGLSGALPYGIGALCEKGKYIAFDDAELVIYSPNAKKCVRVPLSRINVVQKNKAFSFDLIGTVMGKRKGCGTVQLEYTNDKGQQDAALFGPIDACEDFIKTLKEKMEK